MGTSDSVLSEVIERWPCCGASKKWSGFPPMPASTVWHRRDCSTLEPFPLRENVTDPKCDKCASSEIVTTYHTGDWWEFENHSTNPWRADLGTWSCLLTWHYQPEEHLDRTCGTCSFKWLERIAVA